MSGSPVRHTEERSRLKRETLTTDIPTESPIQVDTSPASPTACLDEHYYVMATVAADKTRDHLTAGNTWSNAIEKHIFTQAVHADIDELAAEGKILLEFIADQTLNLSGSVADIIQQMSDDFEQKFVVLQSRVQRFLMNSPTAAEAGSTATESALMMPAPSRLLRLGRIRRRTPSPPQDNSPDGSIAAPFEGPKRRRLATKTRDHTLDTAPTTPAARDSDYESDDVDNHEIARELARAEQGESEEDHDTVSDLASECCCGLSETPSPIRGERLFQSP